MSSPSVRSAIYKLAGDEDDDIGTAAMCDKLTPPGGLI